MRYVQKVMEIFVFLERILFFHLNQCYPLNNRSQLLYTYLNAFSNPQNTSGTQSLR